jgi:hypothetical protein
MQQIVADARHFVAVWVISHGFARYPNDAAGIHDHIAKQFMVVPI